MAEFVGQPVASPLSQWNMMGRPLGPAARAVGYEHCRAMGLDAGHSIDCVNAVAEQLQRDKPYEAMAAAMRYVDLTGTYRLFAVILTAAAEAS